MNNLFQQFNEFASQFVGKECYNVSAGVVGSVFYLDCGSRRVFIDDKEKDRAAWERGEYVIHVFLASWRIDDVANRNVLATCEDDNSENGPMLAALQSLIGKKITSVEIDETGLDCSIAFDDTLVVKIFPIAVEQDDQNYSLWRGNLAYDIGPRSLLKKEMTSGGDVYEGE